MRFSLGLFVVVGALLFGATPAGAQVSLPPLPNTPPDHAVMSDNVEYLGSIKQDVGMTTGAKIIDDRMYVTSAKNISIYDISDPASPQPIGGMYTNVAWENEEVPTNGKVLAVASDFYSVGVPECVAAGAPLGCVQFFDVRDPANIKQVGVIPTANHTAECALDCQYFYGQAGSIIDARGILEGTPPTELEQNWIEELEGQKVGGIEIESESSCHHIREIKPGILLTACRPFVVFSILAKDGASPEHPKAIYAGNAAKFVHSARWPREGKDKLMLTGGEKNFRGRCELNDSEFSVYSADHINKTKNFELLSQVGPAGNGYYADGKPVAGPLGCSVHWFQEHPTFRNGGLVALSEYEDGVRFLQIGKDGKITEQGYFLSLGSSSSSPKWAGKDDILYSIDYLRGIDILRWTGKHYVPGDKTDPGTEGTNGETAPPALTKAQARLLDQRAQKARSLGWAPWLCSLAGRR